MQKVGLGRDGGEDHEHVGRSGGWGIGMFAFLS